MFRLSPVNSREKSYCVIIGLSCKLDNMKYILVILFSTQSFALNLIDFKAIPKRWSVNKSIMKSLIKGNIHSESYVKTQSKTQIFDHFSLGFHDKACYKSLRKLSLLEEYKNLIGFITASTYAEKRRHLQLKADHFLMPFPMIVDIIVDRPTKPGIYPFTFPTGMFTGLQGTLTIKEVDKRCLFIVESKWSGKKSKIPDSILEFFSAALAKLGAQKMFRMTSHGH